MKTLLCLFAAAVLAVVSAAEPDFSGTWSGVYLHDGEGSPVLAVLKQTGSTITGTAGPESDPWPIVKGKAEGAKVSIDVRSSADGTLYKCSLNFAAGHLKGTCDYVQSDNRTGQGQIDFTRSK